MSDLKPIIVVSPARDRFGARLRYTEHTEHGSPPKIRHPLFTREHVSSHDGLRTCATWLSCSSAVRPIVGGVDGLSKCALNSKVRREDPPAFRAHPCDCGALNHSSCEAALSPLFAMKPFQRAASHVFQSIIPLPKDRMQKSKLSLPSFRA